MTTTGDILVLVPWLVRQKKEALLFVSLVTQGAKTTNFTFDIACIFVQLFGLVNGA